MPVLRRLFRATPFVLAAALNAFGNDTQAQNRATQSAMADDGQWTMTIAPLVVKGKVLVGNSGGELGVDRLLAEYGVPRTDR